MPVNMSTRETYDRLVQLVAMNLNRFNAKSNVLDRFPGYRFSPSKVVWGQIEEDPLGHILPDGKQSTHVVYIVEEQFDSMIRSLRLQFPDSIKKRLKALGVTHTEDDRTYYRKTISGVYTNCVALYIVIDYNEGNQYEKALAKELKKKKRFDDTNPNNDLIGF